MVENSSFFKTRKGLISLCTNPVDMALGAAGGTSDDLSAFDFSDNSDKNWGLATKFYVLSSIDEHNCDMKAHEDLFSSILARFEDIVTSSGTFCFNEIRDEEGNSIKANGMVKLNGGSNVGYVVLSNSRNASFDELSAYLGRVERFCTEALTSKQDKLIAGEHINLEYDQSAHRTMISTDYVEYVLPQATETTLGGVYLDGTLMATSENPAKASVVAEAIYSRQKKLSGSNGVYVDGGTVGLEFGTIAEGSQLPVDGNTVKLALDEKQDAIAFSSTHFTSSDGVISPKFGAVSSGSVDIVNGGSVWNAITGAASAKQDTISVDGRYLSLNGTTMSVVTSGKIEEYGVGIPSGGTIFEFASSFSPYFEMTSASLSPDISFATFTTTLSDHSVNTLVDRCKNSLGVDEDLFNKVFEVLIPTYHAGKSRSFKILRKIYASADGESCYLHMQSIDSDGSPITYSYPLSNYDDPYSGTNPFTQFSVSRDYQWHNYMYSFEEIGSHFFKVAMNKLVQT